MSKKVKKLEKELIEKLTEVERIKEELVEAQKGLYLTCLHCKKKSRVDKCIGVDYQGYNENTGSPCGGYWEHWKYCWQCPKCNFIYGNKFKEEEYWKFYNSFKGHKKHLYGED